MKPENYQRKLDETTKYFDKKLAREYEIIERVKQAIKGESERRKSDGSINEEENRKLLAGLDEKNW